MSKDNQSNAHQNDANEKALKHIDELSRNARATWFWLLSLLAFVGITLLGFEDVAFFSRDEVIHLPLPNIAVDAVTFFWVSSTVVTVGYVYFHLYLIALWGRLAELPKEIDGERLSNRIFPWLINYAALWRRHDGSSKSRPLDWVVVLMSILYVWVTGLFILGSIWWHALPLQSTWLGVYTATLLSFAAWVGLTNLVYAIKRLGAKNKNDEETSGKKTTATEKDDVRTYDAPVVTIFMPLLLLLSLLSLSVEDCAEIGVLPSPFLSRADIADAHLTQRPADWKPYEI